MIFQKANIILISVCILRFVNSAQADSETVHTNSPSSP
jgi:hypothetical protein